MISMVFPFLGNLLFSINCFAQPRGPQSDFHCQLYATLTQASQTSPALGDHCFENPTEGNAIAQSCLNGNLACTFDEEGSLDPATLAASGLLLGMATPTNRLIWNEFNDVLTKTLGESDWIDEFFRSKPNQFGPQASSQLAENLRSPAFREALLKNMNESELLRGASSQILDSFDRFVSNPTYLDSIKSSVRAGLTREGSGRSAQIANRTMARRMVRYMRFSGVHRVPALVGRYGGRAALAAVRRTAAKVGGKVAAGASTGGAAGVAIAVGSEILFTAASPSPLAAATPAEDWQRNPFRIFTDYYAQNPQDSCSQIQRYRELFGPYLRQVQACFQALEEAKGVPPSDYNSMVMDELEKNLVRAGNRISSPNSNPTQQNSGSNSAR